MVGDLSTSEGAFGEAVDFAILTQESAAKAGIKIEVMARQIQIDGAADDAVKEIFQMSAAEQRNRDGYLTARHVEGFIRPPRTGR